jgi:hypothetical protein
LREACPIVARTADRELLIIQRRHCRRLGDAVNIEGLPYPIEQCAQFGAGVSIADAKRRQAINFRKRPQAHHVSSLMNQRPQVGRTFQELGVRFVHHRDDVPRQRSHERVQIRLGVRRAGRIIGRAHIHQLRLRSDRG